MTALFALFDRQKEASKRLRLSNTAERLERLRRLQHALNEAESRLIDAAHADTRKPSAEVLLGELTPVRLELRDALKNLPRWMAKQQVPASIMLPGSRAWRYHESRGQSLILSPWNFPVALSLGPLVSAIAAGNSVMIKPSEFTPALSGEIDNLIRNAFSADEVSVIQGDVEISKALLTLPFDHVFFTGSPAVGRDVMMAAARHLSTVTLELGGKSPFVILEDADLDKTAERLVSGKFLNCGQVCLAPDHVYVPRALEQALIDRVRTVLDRRYGRNIRVSPDYARLIHVRHHDFLATLMRVARDEGSQIVIGGEHDRDDLFLAPTLITGVSETSCLMQHELFGPLLPVLAYDDLEKVLDAINTRPPALASYWFGKNQALMQDAIRRTRSGASCINQTGLHYAHQGLPFGGLGSSGIGRAKGFAGFATFSHERIVFDAHLLPDNPLIPPYTSLKLTLARLTHRTLEYL